METVRFAGDPHYFYTWDDVTAVFCYLECVCFFEFFSEAQKNCVLAGFFYLFNFCMFNKHLSNTPDQESIKVI